MAARKKPVGGGGARNPRSLAQLRPKPENLVPGAGAWRPGESPALKAGDRTRAPHPRTVDPQLDPILDALESRVPVRDPDGRLPEWLCEAVYAAGIKRLAVYRMERAVADAADRGTLTPDLIAKQVKVTEAYERSLAGLAMTVTSHARAGLDFTRAQQIDLAKAMAEDAERERREAPPGGGT